MRTAQGTLRSWFFALATAGGAAWPAAAQQAPQPAHQGHGPPAPAAASALEELRKRFDALLLRATPRWIKPIGATEKTEMFQDFLNWPRNPIEVELTVQFTSLDGVGHAIGTLKVKN